MVIEHQYNLNMTVKQLIAELEKIENKDLPVVMDIEYGHGCAMQATPAGVGESEEEVVICGEGAEDSGW